MRLCELAPVSLQPDWIQCLEEQECALRYVNAIPFCQNLSRFPSATDPLRCVSRAETSVPRWRSGFNWIAHTLNRQRANPKIKFCHPTPARTEEPERIYGQVNTRA